MKDENFRIVIVKIEIFMKVVVGVTATRWVIETPCQ